MPKLVDHEAMKQEIAANSVEYFLEKGYQAASMRDIARITGISKSGLYHYFPTKESLFQFCGSFLKEKAASAYHSESPLEQLMELYQSMSGSIVKELYLILDYMKSCPPDKTLEGERGISMTKEYSDEINRIAGKEKSYLITRLIFGELIISSLNGGKSDMKAFKRQLKRILNSL